MTSSTDLITQVTQVHLPELADLATMPAEEQMAAISKARQLSTVAQAYIGKALANLKATVSHGDYEPLLQAHGWNPKTARRYMQFAEFADEVAAINRSALSHLDMTRWLIIRRELDDDTLVRFVSGEPVCGLTLVDADEKGSRELQVAFESHKKSINVELVENAKTIQNLSAELETTKLQKKTLEQQILQRAEHNQFPDFVMATRHESAAMADTTLLCLDDLTRLDNELHEAATTADGGDINIALNSLYTHVNAVLAHAQTVAMSMRDRWGDAIPEQATGEMLYSDAELADIAASRELLIRDHEQEKRLRAHQREDAKPRGRGRPKKL